MTCLLSVSWFRVPEPPEAECKFPAMKTYSSLRVERTILLGFLSVITAGALFIWAFGIAGGRPISLIDSFFTATSATCVTGLTVTDTALLPFPSQIVILVLIQLGGLGIMTVTTVLLLFLRQRISIHEGLYLASGLNIDSPSGAKNLVLRVWSIAFLVEALGCAVLFFGFRENYAPLPALWYALFHSVSAFCNAGFSVFSENLARYACTLLIPGTVMLLITLGGFGFLVLHEFWSSAGNNRPLSPHTVLVLRVSGLLVAAGTILLLMADAQGSLAGLPTAGFVSGQVLYVAGGPVA